MTFPIIILPLIIGIIIGIKCTIFVEALICIGVGVIMCVMGNGKGLEGIMYVVFTVFFIIGTLIGDIYVIFAYPDIRELFFTRVSNAFSWLTSPSGK